MTFLIVIQKKRLKLKLITMQHDSLRLRSILNKANTKANDTEGEFLLSGIIPGSSNGNKCNL